MNESITNFTFLLTLLFVNTTFMNATSYDNNTFVQFTYGLSTLTQGKLTQTASTTATTNTTTAAPNILTSISLPYMIAELVIALLSTVGNLLVCVAVGLNRKLQTVTNYFLVSLAVADICVGSLAIPCAVMADLGIPRHNLYLCLLMLSVLIMLTQSSVFSLLAVAVERYVAIFMPFHYHRLMTPRNAVLVLCVTWTLAFLIGLVPLMGWHKPLPETGYCIFVLVVDMTYMVYFNFFACVLTPLVVMFLIYEQIFVTVKRQMRRIAAERGGATNTEGTAKMKKEMKMATSLFLVLFFFTDENLQKSLQGSLSMWQGHQGW
ncbi:adenosine receptor A2b-like isoform X2 [Megalobrama amblycephala]|uniref:adenosine receptor A2b-like isoform X2 n=1 Tax=Megalobrama amblycephala TaxID=75352 RepID=UPI002014494C|nr:adenosine receptor A2b-like isoform X2 [Megalobrama amblycephala]